MPPKVGSAAKPSQRGFFPPSTAKRVLSVEDYDSALRHCLIKNLSQGCDFGHINSDAFEAAMTNRTGSSPAIDIEIQWEAFTRNLLRQASHLSEPTQLQTAFTVPSDGGCPDTSKVYRKLYGRLLHWDTVYLTPTQRKASLHRWITLPTVLAHIHMHLRCYRQHDLSKGQCGFHQDLARIIDIQFPIDGIESFLTDQSEEKQPISISMLAIQAYQNSLDQVISAAQNQARIQLMIKQDTEELGLGKTVCPKASLNEQALIAFWLLPKLSQDLMQQAIKIDTAWIEKQKTWLEQCLVLSCTLILKQEPSALTEAIREKIESLHTQKKLSDESHEQLCGMLPEKIKDHGDGLARP